LKIAIFCSANNLPEKYTAPAIELGNLLAKSGHALVYGGSDYGLMKTIADTMQAGGAQIIGVTIPHFESYARRSVDELIVAETLGERKATMLERADAIVVLVGGIGTLDETTDVLELRKQSKHTKPILILNTLGFYSGLRTQLERMRDEGFLKMGEQVGVDAIPLHRMVGFFDTPQEILQAINAPAPSRNS
jgi:uncharacterized protein (TIGR00730 family)